ncbi:complex I subunit 1 family protein [Nonomuraea sp. NEAU-A123]|uniref:complex I subunit 1 family protein n=1 Tax=Nonomuraea sp. NEAU-A123 TaxID=2839649 RepID=UPI001BE46D3E|nr:NADH-quinone oxidoreductase subunit H [Nonomuraea sp. NEAU-A123]MBT2226880.1 NADH-quinone oxidoreductase subunit H [Nonomuraea sp. NEAU-A123]
MPSEVLGLAAALAALVWGAAALDARLGASPQSRLVGGGVARPWREAARLLVQQRRRTLLPDVLLTRIGVLTLLLAPVLAATVLPLGGAPVADLDVGVVWFNAMEVCVWAALWLIGWGANSVYPLIGAYRYVAQGLAYELPHMFALITVAVGAGSLRMTDIVQAQHGLWYAVRMPVAFLVYLVSALAMAFWGPMGQPLGRDLAGGVPAELSGADRLLFLAGRYAVLVVVAAAAVPLFLGGGAGPLLPAWAWTLVKTVAVLVLLVVARHRLPAVRMDRFMGFSWLVLIPLTLAQLLVVGIVVLP